MAADRVGLCRRCPSLPRSAWCDSCPLELVAIEGASRIFGPSLAHLPPAVALRSPPAVRHLFGVPIPVAAARAVVKARAPTTTSFAVVIPKNERAGRLGHHGLGRRAWRQRGAG